MPSLVVLTADQPRHHHFARSLATRFDIRGIVVEPVSPFASADDDEQRVIARHFQEREAAERAFFGGDSTWAVDAQNHLEISKGDINSAAVVNWITARHPDVLVAYGSSIVGHELLAMFAGRCLNLHLGLSPYYRGSATNFWPLVNREPELVGATIHLLTSRIDGGPIFAQVRPSIESTDRCHEIGCRAILAGTSAMADVLVQMSEGTVRPVPQSPAGRLYRRQDFTAAAVQVMWRQFDTNMIQDYLAAPHRDDRYPIVTLAG